MNKRILAFAAAALTTAGFLAGGNALATPQHDATFQKWHNDAKSVRASWQDLNVTNANGVILASRKPLILLACTTDKHLVYGNIFAAALPQDVDFVMPETPNIFLHGIKDAFKKSISGMSAVNVQKHMLPQPSLPPAVMQSMRDASAVENKTLADNGNRPLKWIMYTYAITAKPDAYCLQK